MIDEIKALLSRSPKGREILEEAERTGENSVRVVRVKQTREVRALRAQLDKDIPPLAAAVERAEKEREKANAAATEARRRAAEARMALSSAHDTLQRKIRMLEVELAESAPAAFKAFRKELSEGWEKSRARGTEGYLGFRFADATLEGQGLLAKLFLRFMERADTLALDGEIDDADAAVESLRREFVDEAQKISHEHSRVRHVAEQVRQREAEVQRLVVEKEIQWKRRNGCPEDLLEEYRREQLGALA